jgi:hypothetical protein
MWYAGSPEKSNSATYQWLGKGVEGINGVGEEEVGGFCFWVVGVASVASCGTGRTLFGRCVDLVRFVVVCGELSRSANETVIFLCATARTVRGIVVRQSSVSSYTNKLFKYGSSSFPFIPSRITRNQNRLSLELCRRSPPTALLIHFRFVFNSTD